MSKALLSGGPRDGEVVELGKGYHAWVEWEEIHKEKSTGKILSQKIIRYQNTHRTKNRISVFAYCATAEPIVEPTLTKRMVMCLFYEPFALGGNVWQPKRYEVDAEDIDLVEGFKGFVFQNPLSKVFQVHETVTGGCLGDSSTKVDAIALANANIVDTPDLKEQMEKLGDISNHPLVETDEAFRRLDWTRGWAKDKGDSK